MPISWSIGTDSYLLCSGTIDGGFVSAEALPNQADYSAKGRIEEGLGED